MGRKIHYYLLVLAFATMLSACGNNGETVSKEQYDEAIAELSAIKAQNETTVSDEEQLSNLTTVTYNCFSMELPEEWAATENKGDSVTSYALDQGQVLISSFGTLQADLSKEEDVNAIIQWINDDGTISVESSKECKIDGGSAIRISGKANLGNYKSIDMVVFKAGNEFIHITLFADNISSYLEDYEKALDSIMINDAFSSIDDADGTINGFTKAEYGKYNSLASENGLGGTKIYVDGEITELITNPAGIMALVLKQADEEEWLIQVGLDPLCDRSKAEALVGKEIRVFGIYPGLSLEYEKPLIMLWDSNAHIEDNSSLKVYQNDFLSSPEYVMEWCNQNECELFIPDISNEENKGTVKKSSGLVSGAYDSSKSIYIYQKHGDEYQLESLELKNTYFGNTISLDDIEEGDAVTVYYFINNDDGEIQAFGVEKKDTVGFTAEDMKKAYCDSCKAYTYKEIARNPDSVKGEKAKFTGEVIQVMEDGSSVVLRVNITAKGRYYDDTIYVKYTRKADDEDRILEDDIVNIYGTLAGLETYTSITNQSVTLPKVYAEYIDIR